MGGVMGKEMAQESQVQVESLRADAPTAWNHQDWPRCRLVCGWWLASRWRKKKEKRTLFF